MMKDERYKELMEQVGLPESQSLLVALQQAVNETEQGVKEHKEELAQYAHEAWTGWMLYMFGKCQCNTDGSMNIPEWAVERWKRQVNTPYSYLSEEEKQSDRAEADKMLEIISR